MQSATIVQQRSTNVDATRPAGKKLPLAMRVANALSKANIMPFPRNYEVFYAAISGENQIVEAELLGLGSGMKQSELDEIHERHFASNKDGELIENICTAVEEKLSETLQLLQNEQHSVANYNDVLKQASQRLAPSAGVPQDVVNKLVSLLASATETTRLQGSQTLESMQSSTADLAKMRDELEEYKKLAQTDSLTGLHNRRSFDERLAKLNAQSLENTAIIIGDIDKFKNLNDTYGHPFGDKVIKTTAELIKRATRDDVLIARVGGEEFAILSHSINETGMQLLAERVRNAIATTSFGDTKTTLPAGAVTMSFGVCHSSATINGQDLYSLADEALYTSKRTGRNKVSIHNSAASSDQANADRLYQKLSV